MPSSSIGEPLPRPLLADLQCRLSSGHGAVTSAELTELGLGGTLTTTLVKQQILLRVGRGAFVDLAAYRQADARERHVMRAIAVAQTWPAGVVISHLSAAVILEIPLPSLPERIHGCRIATGQHRKNGIYTIHTGYAGAAATRVKGVDVLEPRFVVMGVGEELGRDAAVMAADDALHRRLVTKDELMAACDARPNHPAHALMQRAVELADGRAESPGETRSRLLLLALGFDPVPQVEIRDSRGDFIGRVDFLLEGTRVIVEFDGMTKYGSHEDLVAEKRRELRLQRAGYVVVRLVWSDLADPARVRALIDDALAAAA